MSNNIKFYQGVQSEYNSLGSNIDTNGIYFISDTKAIMKNGIKYGGDDPKIATTSVAGVIKPGNDFDIASDGTLTLYKAMAVNSFSNNINTVEIGSSIPNATFTWNLNKTPNKLTLTSGSQTSNLSATQSGSSVITFTSPLKSSTLFTITATDARNGQASRTSAINFLNGKYYGVSNITDTSKINNDFVKGLSKNLTSTRTGSWTVTANAGQYIYFAVPATFGTPVFFVGGFEGGFNLYKTFDFTNSSGHTASYNVYKSTNAGLGSTTVEVK